MPPRETGDAHEHTEACAELYAAWRRYHGVAEDDSGVFTADDRLTAAHQRDMFARQLRAAGCDPFALLALQQAADAVDDDADVE